MATNIDTGLTAAAADKQTVAPHIFTMSDGYEVVIYYNGTNWGYRIKAPGGSWGGRTALTSSPTGVGSWAQSGNTIMGVVGTTVTIYKLVYSTGTNTITQSNTTNGDTGCTVLCAYIDGTNSRFIFLEGIPSAGVWLYSVAISNLGMFNEQMTANSPPSSFSAGIEDHWSLVGDGTNTCFAVWAESSTVKVVRISSGTTAAATTETAESNVNNLAAASGGLSAIFDGTYVILVANQNGAKLRRSRRSAQDTYDAWSDIVTATITGQPALSKKGTGASADLGVVYRVTGSQANGEIYYLLRLGGTWDSSGTLLAGGASTGWNYPSSNTSDLNGTSGHVPLIYVTGTASTWTLVEDEITIVSTSAAKTGGFTSAGTMGGTKNVLFAKANGIDSPGSLGGQGSVYGVVKTGGFTTPASAGGTKAKAIAKSGKLFSSRYYLGEPVVEMPVISRNLPFYSSQGGAFGGNNAEANAIDADYGTTWNSVFTPAANGPQWYAIDISGIADAVKSNLWLIWKNGRGDYYDPTSTLGSQSTSPFAGLPKDYKVQAHTGAGGGAPPAAGDAGWTDVITPVTNNRYNARIHTGINLTGYNWFRIYVTESSGIATVNDSVILEFDLRDVRKGSDDSILFHGDSITWEGFEIMEPGNVQYPQGPPPLGPIQNILEYRTKRIPPVAIDAGRGGWGIDTAVANMADYIGTSPCKYVTLNFGTNDAHNANIDLSTVGGTASTFAQTFKTNYQTVIDYCVSLGKKVIIPDIPWRADAGVGVNEPGNVQILNQILAQVRAANPDSVIPGPLNFYTFFNTNQNLLRDTPKIHPTFDDGISGGKLSGLTGYEWFLSYWADQINNYLYGATNDHMLGATKGVAYAGTGGPRSVLTLGGARTTLNTKTAGISTPALLGATVRIAGFHTGGPVGAASTGASRSVSAAKTGGESSSASLGGTKAYTAAKTAGFTAVGTLGGPKAVNFTRTSGISSILTLGGTKSSGFPKTGGIAAAGTLGGSKTWRAVKTAGITSPSRVGATEAAFGVFPRTGGFRSVLTVGGARFQFPLTGGISSAGRLGGTTYVAKLISGTKPGMLTSVTLSLGSGKLIGANLDARN